MAIDADLVRQLVARRESDRLDFKAEWYDWAGDGNLELTKDIAAMANGLAPDDPPAYILIGVDVEQDQTGKLVGIPPGSHLDEACYQQKVGPHLNRAPNFEYAPVSVDGFSVGVFEIRPGRRPFYSLKDLQKSRPPKGNILRKHEAPIRRGSSTDPASPDEIQEWARRDDLEARAARRLELEAREASLRIFPVLASLEANHVPTHQNESGQWTAAVALFAMTIENHGDAKFSIVSTRTIWTSTDKFRSDWAKMVERDSHREDQEGTASTLPTDIPPLVQESEMSVPILVQPGTVSPIFQLSLGEADVSAHIDRHTGCMIASGSWVDWVVGRTEIQCRGTSGRTAVVSVVLVPLAEELIRARERAKREAVRAMQLHKDMPR